jgi:glycosyltransferase involved in cell wall biosynthesis
MREPISALLPIKNGQEWLNTIVYDLNSTLDSGDELIIVDDHSTDSTIEILSGIAFKPRLKLLSNPGSGLVSALNEGIKQATNEWVARYDVDDSYDADRINKQMQAITPSTVAIFSDYKIWGENKEFFGYIPSPLHPTATALSLLRSDRTAHPSVIFRKSAVASVGYYQEDDFPSEDLSLWVRLLAEGEIKSIDHALLNYTLRKSSVSSTRYSEAKMKTERILCNSFGYKKIAVDAASDFSMIMSTYSQSSFGVQRKLLFLRDLLSPSIFSSFGVKKRLMTLFYLSAFLIKPTHLFIALQLAYYQRKRKRYRIH